MLPNDVIKTQKIENGILNAFLDIIRPATPSPDAIAEAAYRETSDVPTFGSNDKFHVMIERINRTMGPHLSDDDQAAVIHACRRRAGVTAAAEVFPATPFSTL